jgi:hypothetical protein
MSITSSNLVKYYVPFCFHLDTSLSRNGDVVWEGKV